MVSDAVVECLDDFAPEGREVLVFVNVYLDRGQRPDAGGIMSIGCSVFRPTPYKQFVRAWKKHLSDLGGVPYIHATDFYGGWDIYKGIPKPLRDDVAAAIPGTVRAHAKLHVAVSFKAEEFKAVSGQAWANRFGTLYTTAVQMAMGAVGHWCNEINYRDRISYFYESGDDEEPELASRLASLPQHIRDHTRMRTAAPMPKGEARGLESADVLSWHWNKLYAETIARHGVPRTGDKAKDWRWPRRDTAALFDDGPGTKPRVFLFTGAELEYTLKRMWDPTMPARAEFQRPSQWNALRDELLRAAKSGA